MLLRLFIHCLCENVMAFMLDQSGKISLLQHSELGDTYPLKPYFVGDKHMVKLRRHMVCQC